MALREGELSRKERSRQMQRVAYLRAKEQRATDPRYLGEAHGVVHLIGASRRSATSEIARQGRSDPKAECEGFRGSHATAEYPGIGVEVIDWSFTWAWRRHAICPRSAHASFASGRSASRGRGVVCLVMRDLRDRDLSQRHARHRDPPEPGFGSNLHQRLTFPPSHGRGTA